MIGLLIFFASFTISPSNEAKVDNGTYLRDTPKKKPTIPKKIPLQTTKK